MQQIFHPDNNNQKKKKDKIFEKIVHLDKNETKRMMEVKCTIDLSNLISK